MGMWLVTPLRVQSYSGRWEDEAGRLGTKLLQRYVSVEYRKKE